MKPALFTIGLYQLENLLVARPSFRFLDLRIRPQIVALTRVQAVLTHASVVRSAEIKNHLQATHAQKTDPIVLLCEDGRLSASVGDLLDGAGYQQIYIVEGGLDGLLREASLSD